MAESLQSSCDQADDTDLQHSRPAAARPAMHGCAVAEKEYADIQCSFEATSAELRLLRTASGPQSIADSEEFLLTTGAVRRDGYFDLPFG